LLTLLASQLKIGAYVGLSGWMPFQAHTEKIVQIELNQQSKGLADFSRTIFGLEIEYTTPAAVNSVLDTPVFLGHMLDDEIIDVELGQQTRTILEEMGMKVV